MIHYLPLPSNHNYTRTSFIRFFSFALVLLFFSTTICAQNYSTIEGVVTNEKGQKMALVSIYTSDKLTGTVSDSLGKYKIQIPADKEITLHYTFISFETHKAVFQLKKSETKTYSPTLLKKRTLLPTLTVSPDITPNTGNTISTLHSRSLPTVGLSNIETMVKLMPGVTSNNEMSLQYSVRGGNYDENLIYINDFEVFQPNLVRSGEQEGLSFINPNLVAHIQFFSGGFEAKYGDKMASVLDIKYKKPRVFKGSVTSSLLGHTAYLEGVSKNKKFTYLTGIRYKTNSYIIRTLDTKGDYQPHFYDAQILLTYNLNPKLELNFIANSQLNNYTFIPQTRTVAFNTLAVPSTFKIYFDGEEKDKFLTSMEGIRFLFKPQKNLNLKLLFSNLFIFESETYDIISQYWIPNDTSTVAPSKKTEDADMGTSVNHAKNRIETNLFTIEHKGNYRNKKHTICWGAKLQLENTKDKTDEWEWLILSSDTSPPSKNNPERFHSKNGKNNIKPYRISTFVQDEYNLLIGNHKLFITAGLRAYYYQLNNEISISPRASFTLFPNGENKVNFKLSAGIYKQAPFYKELRDPNGNINKNIQSQNSFQIVFENNYIFYSKSDHFFKLTTDIYYKKFTNLIPYTLDNIKIEYSGRNNSEGYAVGADMRLRSKLPSGTEWWLNASYLKTEEKIKNATASFIPRPYDRRFNFSMFLKDQMPNYPSLEVFLTLFWGSGLPFGPPNNEDLEADYRMPSYRRADIGLSKKIEKNTLQKMQFTKFAQRITLSTEVFNVFNTFNVISYYWINDVKGDQFAVPNYLTSRRFNLTLKIDF